MIYRYLFWGVCPAVAAMLAAHYFPGISPWAAAVAVLLTIPWLILLLLSGKRQSQSKISRDWCVLFLIILFCTSAGFLRSWAHYELTVSRAEAYAGQTQTGTFLLRDYPSDGENYAAVTAWFFPDDGSRKVSILLSDYDGFFSTMELEPGSLISAEVKLVSAQVSHGENTDSYTSRGIYLRGNVKAQPVIIGNETDIFAVPRTLAYQIKQTCLKVFPEDVSAFMMALLTGDKSLLAQQDAYSYLRDAGISHMVAVSGMHVAFLVGALRVLTGRKKKTASIAIPFILFFMAMTGFTASVVRAGVMQILVLAAPLFHRETDAPTTLAFAALVVLLPNPDAVAGTSFQLSFAAVAGMMLVCPWLSEKYREAVEDRKTIFQKLLGSKPGKAVYSAAAGTVGALLFTLPLTSLHFGSFALYGILTNILTVWAVSGAFILGYAVCIVSLLFPTVGSCPGKAVAVFPKYILWVAEKISGFPYAVIYTRDNLASWGTAVCYLILGLSVCCRGKERWKPVLPLSQCAAVFCICFAAMQLSGERNPVVTAIDVGQGQSIAILEKNCTAVIDCGNTMTLENAGDLTAAYLASRGRSRIDVLMLTHLHKDHASGVLRLMQREKIGMIILPDYPEEYRDETWYSITQTAEQKGIRLVTVSGCHTLETPQMELQIYNPGGEDENDIGLIFLGTCGDFDFLVTGDAEMETEEKFLNENDLPDIELYIAGHHGSKYSTSDELLEELTPDCCFISVGYNTYGHPAQETLERLSSHGIPVYTTRECGNLEMALPVSQNE